MTDFEALVDGETADAGEWRVEWEDRPRGLARLVAGGHSVPALVEGGGTDWVVTLRGRRIGVVVRTWRERLLAEAETASRVRSGPMAVKATLPGLVVAVAVAVDDEVEEGASLLTIEAMKMQNEVRAPRAGRVIELAVEPGRAVATGSVLLRLE